MSSLTNKFYTGGSKSEGKARVEWINPSGDAEREFALDMAIKQLVEVVNCPLNTLVKLSERTIKWLIKESQEIFKVQSMLLDVSIKPGTSLNVVGDIHG